MTRPAILLGVVPVEHVLVFACILLALGALGLMARRNLLFMLMSVEVMLNASAAAFIGAGARWGMADGQVMFFFILTMSAAEAAVALVLLFAFYRRRQSLDSDRASQMKG